MSRQTVEDIEIKYKFDNAMMNQNLRKKHICLEMEQLIYEYEKQL